MTGKPQLLIVTGGAEVVSIAIAEAAWRSRIDYAVISLVPDSLLRGSPGCIHFHSIWSKSFSATDAATRLLHGISALAEGRDAPIPVFPTEDDGLFLLNKLQGQLSGIAEFSRGAALSMGGLDKSELFRLLQRHGLDDFLASTLSLESPDQFDQAVETMGPSLIIKPAYKPWQASVGASGLKVVTQEHKDESLSAVRSRLIEAWPLCDRWVAQARLLPLDGGERSACIVRSGDEINGCEVLEQLKYPRLGGSAVWVRTSQERGLMAISRQIAAAIELKGMCELSFLSDRDGKPRLLELNTRPWLQVDLVEKSGFPIIMETLAALRNESLQEYVGIQDRSWIQPERLFLSLITGDCGPRLAAARRLIGAMNAKTVYPVYGSSLPKIKRKWVLRNLRRAKDSLANS